MLVKRQKSSKFSKSFFVMSHGMSHVMSSQMSCHITCHVMSHVMSYVMSHVMSCHVMLCLVISYHVMSCHVMSCQDTKSNDKERLWTILLLFVSVPTLWGHFDTSVYVMSCQDKTSHDKERLWTFLFLLLFVSVPTMWGHFDTHCYCKEQYIPHSWTSRDSKYIDCIFLHRHFEDISHSGIIMLLKMKSMKLVISIFCSNSECQNVLTMLVNR